MIVDCSSSIIIHRSSFLTSDDLDLDLRRFVVTRQAVSKTKISPMIDFCRRNNAQPTYFASFFLANAPDIIRRTVKYRPELYKI